MSTTTKQETKKEVKPKTAKRLFDAAKRKHQSDRPTNCYLEFVTDDESGIGQWYIWYTTEQGGEVGRKSLTRRNEFTDEIIQEGQEFTVPYSRKAFDALRKKTWGRMHWAKKDGQQRIGFESIEVLEKFALDLDAKPKE